MFPAQHSDFYKALTLGASVLLILYALIRLIFPYPTYAAIAYCEATVGPSSAYANSSVSFNATVSNMDNDATVSWVRISPPSGNYTVSGGSADGWSASVDGNVVIYTGGSIGSGEDQSFSISVTTGGEETRASWTMQTSDDGGGADPTSCAGSHNTSISGSAPDEDPPEMTSVLVSAHDTYAVVTWTTNEDADSVVDYGSTESYGQTVSDSNRATSHSLTISGLTASTTYHLNVKSSDASSNMAESGDNSFTTAAAGTVEVNTVTVTVTVTRTETRTDTVTRYISPTPTPTPTPDLVPPRAVMATSLKKAFEVSPTLKGTATDGTGVSAIEYSIDNGRNWLPVDEISNPGSKSVSFTISMPDMDDDTYQLRIRSTDTLGNTGSIGPYQFIVDRLPPQIGASILNYGPFILETIGIRKMIAGQSGAILSLAAVGGPTDVLLYASRSGELAGPPFRLSKNPDTKLWTVPLSFPTTGDWNLSIHATDGVGSIRTRDLPPVRVIERGMVTDTMGNRISNAIITVYGKNSDTNRFVLWDGKPTGQDNPIQTNNDGSYALMLPPGEYYLFVTGPNLKPVDTALFTLTNPTAITQSIVMNPVRTITIFGYTIPVPSFVPDTIAFSPTQANGETESVTTHPLVGQELPYFSVLNSSNSTVTSYSLYGKPTLLTVASPWHPFTPSMLAVLSEVGKNQDIQTVVLLPEVTASSVQLYSRRGGYMIPMVADPDGTTIEPLDITSLPMTFVLTRKGMVSDVLYGLRTASELKTALQ